MTESREQIQLFDYVRCSRSSFSCCTIPNWLSEPGFVYRTGQSMETANRRVQMASQETAECIARKEIRQLCTSMTGFQMEREITGITKTVMGKFGISGRMVR